MNWKIAVDPFTAYFVIMSIGSTIITVCILLVCLGTGLIKNNRRGNKKNGH